MTIYSQFEIRNVIGGRLVHRGSALGTTHTGFATGKSDTSVNIWLETRANDLKCIVPINCKKYNLYIPYLASTYKDLSHTNWKRIIFILFLCWKRIELCSV